MRRASWISDGARKSLQDFLSRRIRTRSRRTTRRKRLDQVNADAKARFTDAQKKKTEGAEIPDAMRIWDDYAKDLKDQANAPDVEKARKALKQKADDLTKAETDKASQEGARLPLRRSDSVDGSAGAESQNDGVRSRREGAPRIVLRSESTSRQDAERRRSNKIKSDGPQLLDFYEDPKLKEMKWALTGIAGEVLQLDSTSKEKAGTSKKLPMLTPVAQYQFHKLFQPDDHRGLLELCKELNLAKEAEAEQVLAAKPK